MKNILIIATTCILCLVVNDTILWIFLFILKFFALIGMILGFAEVMVLMDDDLENLMPEEKKIRIKNYKIAGMGYMKLVIIYLILLLKINL